MNYFSKILVKTTPLRYRIEGCLYQFFGETAGLKKLRQLHQDKPMLVIGNGPSLKKTPLDDFRDVFSIGMNKINLLFPKVEWRPDMLLCTNNLVVQQNKEYFANSEIPVYLSWKARWFMPRRDRKKVHYFLQLPDNRFSDDLPSGLGHGHSVTYSAIQFAYYMGADPVIIFGVDHSFKSQGKALSIVKAEGEDENHFDPNYFSNGVRWGIPDLDGSERDFQTANEAFNSAGRRIFDATIGGKLDIFPKISVEEARRLCGICEKQTAKEC